MTYLEFKVKLKNIMRPKNEDYHEITETLSEKITSYCDDNRDKFAAYISAFRGGELRFMISGNCNTEALPFFWS